MLTILVTGDRNWVHEDIIRDELLHWKPKLVVHGAARGADSLAAKVCHEEGISVYPVYAEWEKYGRAAGPIRNRRMLAEVLELAGPVFVLAFHWDLDKSKGTKDMVRRALKAGLPVRLIC